jgi:hypothetical protein
LNLGQVPHHYDDLRRRYQISLYFVDLASYRGNIRIQQLTSQFNKKYSNEFLIPLGCEIAGKHQRNWVARIGQKGSIQHPLRHLLILNLISKPVFEFLAFKLEIQPFPDTPYPCLNKICPYFHKDVIEEVRLGISRRQGRSPMGTFACPHCEFTYCRVGPDQKPESRSRGKTFRYGWLWDQTLRELWDTKLLRTEIADRLNVEYDTMMRQVNRLQIQYANEEMNPPETISQTSDREQWLAVLRENPGKGAAILAETYSQLYSSLERFDLNWLEAHLPDERFSQALQKVDWAARDLKLYPQVAGAAESIREQSHPPRRISANSIGIALGYRDGEIHKELPKMPNTQREILKYSESQEEFAIRRIHLTVHGLKYVPTVAQLIKLAGLSISIQSEKVLVEVHKVIEELQYLFGDNRK